MGKTLSHPVRRSNREVIYLHFKSISALLWWRQESKGRNRETSLEAMETGQMGPSDFEHYGGSETDRSVVDWMWGKWGTEDDHRVLHLAPETGVTIPGGEDTPQEELWLTGPTAPWHGEYGVWHTGEPGQTCRAGQHVGDASSQESGWGRSECRQWRGLCFHLEPSKTSSKYTRDPPWGGAEQQAGRRTGREGPLGSQISSRKWGRNKELLASSATRGHNSEEELTTGCRNAKAAGWWPQ